MTELPGVVPRRDQFAPIVKRYDSPCGPLQEVVVVPPCGIARVAAWSATSSTMRSIPP
jgi:hypothetical protein